MERESFIRLMKTYQRRFVRNPKVHVRNNVDSWQYRAKAYNKQGVQANF